MKKTLNNKAASIKTTSRLLIYLLTSRKLADIIQDNQATIQQAIFERGINNVYAENLKGNQDELYQGIRHGAGQGRYSMVD